VGKKIAELFTIVGRDVILAILAARSGFKRAPKTEPKPTPQVAPSNTPAAKLPVKRQLPGAGKFPKDPRSKPVTGPLDPGEYVYVQDADGVVNVLPQGDHIHPKVLGGGQPAAAAGEIIVDANGVVTEINNISGTFQHEACVLGAVKTALEKAGLKVAADALKPFSW
jgi:hypothetical protein